TLAEAARHVRAVRQEQERRESRDARESRDRGNGRDRPESRESPRSDAVTEASKCPSPPKMSDSIISTGLGSTTSSTNSLITERDPSVSKQAKFATAERVLIHAQGRQTADSQ
ncbi:hypothetical protein ANCDUO_26797, partial [Ancylostoma duodenale]